MSHRLGATTTTRGALVLAGHLGGTADSPSVGNFNLQGTGQANSNKIAGLADGVDDTDAASLGQVRALFFNQDYKASVRVATAAALPAYTRTGSVLEANAFGDINNAGIDGIVDLVNGDRVLVKNGAADADNGIYAITDIGDTLNPWVLTRATDADSSAEVTPGMICGADVGTANGGHYYRLVTAGPVTLNTTALTFTDFSAVSYGAASALVEGAASNGAATSLSRSDHNHGTNPSADGDDWGADTLRWRLFAKTLNLGGAEYLTGTAVKSVVFSDSPYTVETGVRYIRVDTSGGAVTVVLPVAASDAGRVLDIKRVAGTNAVTIDGDGTETIDGATTLSLDVLYSAVRLFSDGASAWDVLG